MRRVLAAVMVVALVSPILSAADVDVRNEAEFKKLMPEGAKVEKLATGFMFTEGPCWLDADAGYLVFSDIPANHLKKWTRKDGVGVFRDNSNKANGNTRDAYGRLVTAEHGSRSITRTGSDGKVETLVDKIDGKRFNSPNDVVVKTDETVWFTDPDYGLEGRAKEVDGNYVYRFDPKSKEVKAVAKGFDKPNGLCFSPDEKRLYVADSGKPRHIRVFDVNDDGTVSEGRVFCAIDRGGPDGIRCDTDGRIWSSAGDGVHVFGNDGKLIGKILVPESPANLCFGGADGKTLFITARKSLYAVSTNAMQAGPKKQQ